MPKETCSARSTGLNQASDADSLQNLQSVVTNDLDFIQGLKLLIIGIYI